MSGVFARARTYACMSIVREHACMYRVRMHACTLCGRMLVCDCVHVRSGVHMRMCACAGVFARVRAHACVFMRGCVCACVVGPTCARVHACLRALARMGRVQVHVRSRAGARA